MLNTEVAAKPDLRNTLSSKNLPRMKYVRQTFLEKIVIPSGYPFFEWNDRVYAVEGGTAFYAVDTDVLFEDLK
jgi:hypothetical protein